MKRYIVTFGNQIGHFFTEVAQALASAPSAETLALALPDMPLTPLSLGRANAVRIRPFDIDADEISVHHTYTAKSRADLPLAA